VSAKERQETTGSHAHGGAQSASPSGAWPRRAFAATRCISGAATQDTRYAAAHRSAFLADARFSPPSRQPSPRTQPQTARYEEARSAAADMPPIAQTAHQG
jgi:hypothetical protein